MRCDEKRKETTAAATAKPHSTSPYSLSSHRNSISISAPLPPEEDMEWEFLSDDQRLARIFHYTLPPENQEAAPEAWEKIWSKDLAGLREDYQLIREVIEYAATKKDKTGARIYVRTLSFVENFARLEQEVLKVRKANKAKSNGHSTTPGPVIPVLTEKERERSGKCVHNGEPKECMECHMMAL
jgi:hypothetical protein